MRARIRQIMSADHANVPPSTRNAWPVPNVPVMMPPIIGPISISEAGRTIWPRAFASTSASSGTIEGTIAWNDGPKRA